jgi:hypothetical protein
VAKKAAAAPGEVKPARILAAIVPHQDSVYYIKATEEPGRYVTTFDELKSVVEKLTFSETGEPKWVLPDGWEQLPGSGISIATLQANNATPPIRFAVTVLGGPQSGWDTYLEDNINRWRGQLMLEEVPLAEQRSSMTEIPREGEKNPAYLVDITGSRQEGAPSGMRAPFLESMGMMPPSGEQSGTSAGGPGPSTPAAPPTAQSASPDASAQPSPIQYQAPDNWTYRGTGAFRLATFEVNRDGEKAEVTVSTARNNLAENASMWQRQVDPESTDEVRNGAIEQALKGIETATFEKGEGQVILFQKNEEDVSPAILIAVIPTENPEESIFVKFRGSLRLAKAERQSLIDFAKTIRR